MSKLRKCLGVTDDVDEEEERGDVESNGGSSIGLVKAVVDHENFDDLEDNPMHDKLIDSH